MEIIKKIFKDVKKIIYPNTGKYKFKDFSILVSPDESQMVCLSPAEDYVNFSRFGKINAIIDKYDFSKHVSEKTVMVSNPTELENAINKFPPTPKSNRAELQGIIENTWKYNENLLTIAMCANQTKFKKEDISSDLMNTLTVDTMKYLLSNFPLKFIYWDKFPTEYNTKDINSKDTSWMPELARVIHGSPRVMGVMGSNGVMGTVTIK